MLTLEYKITRGLWDTEAVGKDWKVLESFFWIKKNDTTITVERWEDLDR
jgi:hypothetical protein